MRVSARIDTSSIPLSQRYAEYFGFVIPRALASFLDRARDIKTVSWQSSSEHETRDLDLYDALGFYLTRNDFRYGGKTPPEVFVFGSTGCDGVHYGCINHAPELGTDDLPVGHCSPTDSEAIYLVGTDTKAAIEARLWSKIEYDGDERDLVMAYGKELGVTPSQQRFDQQYIDGNGAPIIPHVPSGWVHVKTADGIGVLADKRHFGSLESAMALTPYHIKEQSFALESAVKVLDSAPALALVYLRELRWCSTIYDHDQERIDDLMKLCYRRLGREVLCAQLDIEMGSFPAWRN